MHVLGVDEHELVPHVSSLKLHVPLFVLKIVGDYLANWYSLHAGFQGKYVLRDKL
jgi:hypothetical protein